SLRTSPSGFATRPPADSGGPPPIRRGAVDPGPRRASAHRRGLAETRLRARRRAAVSSGARAHARSRPRVGTRPPSPCDVAALLAVLSPRMLGSCADPRPPAVGVGRAPRGQLAPQRHAALLRPEPDGWAGLLPLRVGCRPALRPLDGLRSPTTHAAPPLPG